MKYNSGKGKIIEISRRPVVARGLRAEGRKMNRWNTKKCRTVKLLWLLDIMYLSKLIKLYNTMSELQCKLWTLVHNNGSIMVNKL